MQASNNNEISGYGDSYKSHTIYNTMKQPVLRNRTEQLWIWMFLQ